MKRSKAKLSVDLGDRTLHLLLVRWSSLWANRRYRTLMDITTIVDGWGGGAKLIQPEVSGNDNIFWLGRYSDDIGLDTKLLPTKAWHNLSVKVNGMNTGITNVI